MNKLAVKDSYDIYNEACLCAATVVGYSLNKCPYYREHNNCNTCLSEIKKMPGNCGCLQVIDRIRSIYVQIIKYVTNELLIKKHSKLISHLCSLCGVKAEGLNLTRFSIGSDSIEQYQISWGWCLRAIVWGVKEILQDRFDNIEKIYSDNYGFYMFASSLPNVNETLKNKFLKNEHFMAKEITDGLKDIDTCISNIFGIPQVQKKAAPVVAIINGDKLADKLNERAEKQCSDDSDLSGKLAEIQISLQEVQKLSGSIMELRDSVEYNASRKAVDELFGLYEELEEIIVHNMPENSNNCQSCTLIEDCKELLSSIEYALSLFGVKTLGKTNEAFDVKIHEAVGDMKPSRSALVKSVIKVGFIYKNNVLRKSQVELD